MLGAFQRLRDTGVLGMNRRNADYIMRFNPRSAFPLLDDKVLTKELARRHEIPTPKLHHIVEQHGDIVKLQEALENLQEFVIKPARGSGGSGIILVAGRVKDAFLKKGGATLRWNDLAYHLSDILSGIYSLEGLEDRVVIESLVHPDPVFEAVSYRGVPDVRVLVYRGVPIMGMVRLPTKASDGKANLHRGAIGVGIDMATGKTLRGVHRAGTITHHPDTGAAVADIQVPYWEEMLLIAAKSFDMTGMGYMGVDLVLDEQMGPLLLELNARPGLQIQIANQAGLLNRLNLVDGVTEASPGLLSTPEARATWAVQGLG